LSINEEMRDRQLQWFFETGDDIPFDRDDR
jgi:hypothetical protein